MKQKNYQERGKTHTSLMPQKWLLCLLTLLVTFVGSGRVAAEEVTWTASNTTYTADQELSTNTGIVSVKLGDGTWSYLSVGITNNVRGESLANKGAYIEITPAVNVDFSLTTYSSANNCNLVVYEGDNKIMDFRQRQNITNNLGVLKANRTYYVFGVSFKGTGNGNYADMDYVYFKSFTATTSTCDNVNHTVFSESKPEASKPANANVGTGSDGYNTAFSQFYELESGFQYHYTFKIAGGATSYQNWYLQAAKSKVHNGDTGWDGQELLWVRQDRHGFFGGSNVHLYRNSMSEELNAGNTNGIDDATFINDMKNATVDMTVSYADNKLFVFAKTTATSGNKYYLTGVKDADNGGNPIQLFFGVEASKITNLVAETRAVYKESVRLESGEGTGKITIEEIDAPYYESAGVKISYIEVGREIKIYATPKSGYKFDRIGSVNTNPRTFTTAVPDKPAEGDVFDLNFLLPAEPASDGTIGAANMSNTWVVNAGEGSYSKTYQLINYHEYTFTFDCVRGTTDNQTWNSWVVTGSKDEVSRADAATLANRTATKFILRPDSWVFDEDTNGDGNIDGADTGKSNPALATADGSPLNWEQFKKDLNGAHVTIKVSYDMNEHKVFVYEVIESADKTRKYTYYYPYIDEENSLGDRIWLNIGVDRSQLTNFTATNVQGYKFTTSVNPANSGKVVMTNAEGGAILEGAIVGQGTPVTLTATANDGYVFKEWSSKDVTAQRVLNAGNNIKSGYTHEIIAYFNDLKDFNSSWTCDKNPGAIYYNNSDHTMWAKSDINGSDAYTPSTIPGGTDFTGAYKIDGTEIDNYKELLFNSKTTIRANGNIRLHENGGAIKIPVVAGEIVYVKLSNGAGDRTLGVENANANSIKTTKNSTTHTLIAKENGYITINNSSNDMHTITAISKSLIYDFTFADGDNVAATPGTSYYLNAVAATSQFPLLDGATYIWTSSNPSEVYVDRNTGVVTVNESFSGNVDITATRVATGNYPAIAKSYTLSGTTNELHHDNEETHAQVELNESNTAVFDVDAYWKTPDDPYIAGKDIKYTVIHSTAKEAKPTPDEEGLGTSEIAIEGKGVTTVMASCGAISCTFYIDTYGFVFDESAIIFDFAGTTFTRTVQGATSYSMEKIGAISGTDCTINTSNGEITGLPAYDDNKGGALVVKTTQAPTNVTATYIANPKFDDNITDWTNNIANSIAGNDGYQTSGKYSPLDNFIEAWININDGTLADGQIYNTLESVPAGKYTLKVDAIAVNQSSGPATNVYLFAQEGNREWQTVKVSTANQAPQEFTLNFNKIKGDTDLKIGIATRSGDGTVNANWIAADNFTLSQYKEASYVLTIPYKKYTWNFYNENDVAAIADAQKLTSNHLTMGDLTANGNPHAASEVEAKTTIEIPNTGDTYPGKYVIDDIYNSVAPADYDAAHPNATTAEKDANSKYYGHKQAILRELTWQSIQNGEENDQTHNDAHMFWNYTFKTRMHKNRSASEPVEYTNEPLFSYKNAVNGNNVRIIKDTQGLIFNAGANAFGINDSHYTGGTTADRETDRAVLMYKGTEFTVPFVKQGDYVKLHWYRHSTNAGDLFSVTNAKDLDGNDIAPDHVLRFTGSHYEGGSDGVYRGLTIVQAKENGPITFTAKANSWIEIYTVELTDVYETELKVMYSNVWADARSDGFGGPMQSGYTDGNMLDMHDNVIHVVRDARSNESYEESALATIDWNNSPQEGDRIQVDNIATTPTNRFGKNPIIYIGSFPGHTLGWNGWNLDVECVPVPEDEGKLSIGISKGLLTRIGNRTSYGVNALTNFKGTGTAHVIVRTKSGAVTYTDQQTKITTVSVPYALDKQEAYFPVGEYQPQEYPYTWDFRDYNINGTKTGSNGIQHRNMSSARATSYGGWSDSKLATWTKVGATVQADRNHREYNKFLFADGSQLTMNQSNNNGATYIREAEGLRFDLADERWTKGHEFNSNSSVTMNGNNLSVSGTITIPEVKKGMFVFVRSTNKPTSVTGAEDYTTADEINKVYDRFMKSADDTSAPVCTNKGDILENVWVYKVTNEGKTDVVITPNGAVEAIGVTDIFKLMTKAQNIDRSTWVTESRPERIDYSNSGLFTYHNLKSYVVKTKSEVDEDGEGHTDLTGVTVVPGDTETEENRGLVLYDDLSASATNATARPLIPLFVPACNIPNSDIAGNRLVDHIEESYVEVPDANYEKMRYILTNAYYDYNKATKTLGSEVKHAEDICFYVLRQGSLMRANSSYLDVDRNEAAGIKMLYLTFDAVGDEETGINEVAVAVDKETIETASFYTLSGVKLSGVPTKSGVYIMNGKKVFVK